MNQPGHGGARAGAGRKTTDARRVKRAVTLSRAADALVVAQQQPDESYSAALERVLLSAQPGALRVLVGGTPMLRALLAQVTPERQAVAVVYRGLGWSRQQLERLIQTERAQLGELGVHLHVATKDMASGRREQYITVDGMRYSALSWKR